MEKRADIERGVTPDTEQRLPKERQKTAAAGAARDRAALDDDMMKRAADKVQRPH